MYTTKFLRHYLDDPLMIPVTCTANNWSGAKVRLYTVANGRAMMTTGWKNVINGACIEEDDICMFCFYNGGPAMGCFITRLGK